MAKNTIKASIDTYKRGLIFFAFPHIKYIVVSIEPKDEISVAFVRITVFFFPFLAGMYLLLPLYQNL